MGNTETNIPMVQAVPEGKDGFIQVENNQIDVIDPKPGGKSPSMEALSPVVVKINGNVLEGKKAVKSTDVIEWTMDNPPPFEIQVVKDHLEAYFLLHSICQNHWKLKDASSAPHLILEAVEDMDQEPIELTMEMVIQEIRRMNIIDPNLHAIKEELEQPTYRPIRFAEGIKPIDGIDAEIKLYFSNEIESSLQEVDGKVDYRNHIKIPFVKTGDVIAKKTPPIPGKKGSDVFGKQIEPKEPKDKGIVAVKDVMINQFDEVIALKDGRPRMAKEGHFDISTAYIVNGDVNLETGNIMFAGDVIVYGNVTDGMMIESLGSVFVAGNVYQATIITTGSITVKGNIVGSKLYSGYYGVILNSLYRNVKELEEAIQVLILQIREFLKHIQQRQGSANIGRVVLLLLENNRHKRIPSIVCEMDQYLSILTGFIPEEERDDLRWMQEVKPIIQMLQSKTKIGEVRTVEEIEKIYEQLKEIQTIIENKEEVLADVEISNGYNTEVKAHGNIHIIGKGVLNSSLYSKKDIIFDKKGSSCRGGILEAEGVISAQTVGTPNGNKSILKAGESIHAQLLYYGELCVKGFCKEILLPIHHIKAERGEVGLEIREIGKLTV